MSVIELPTVTLIPNGIHHPPIEDGRLLPNSVKENKEIREITIHGFRHTHCSLLFEAGATLKEVQDRLGHANSDITLKIYTHVTTEAKRETANKLALYLDS